MGKFSPTSLKRLSTCDPRLQAVANAAIARIDFTVLCGHRGEAEQNDAFERGTSKLRFPNSKHNTFPSQAMDLAPYPIDWNNLDRFKALAQVIKKEAARLGVRLTWGGEWRKFQDYPHYQLEE